MPAQSFRDKLLVCATFFAILHPFLGWNVLAQEKEAFEFSADVVSLSISDDDLQGDFVSLQQESIVPPQGEGPRRQGDADIVPTPPRVTSPTPTTPSPRPFQPSFARLARIPNMFGKSLPSCASYSAGSAFSVVTLPVCPKGGQFDISTNQSALPQDRIFFNYNYFDDAFAVTKTPGFVGDPITADPLKSFNINRYTIGVERKIWDDRASVQVQIPIVNTLDSTTPGFLSNTANPVPGDTDTELGNIAFALKSIVYRSCNSAVSAGIGIDLPTASDISTRRNTPSFLNPNGGDMLSIENEAITISPFLGMIAAPTENWFLQGFAQVAIPVNDNSFYYLSQDHFGEFGLAQTIPVNGEVNVQSLLHLDVSLGHILYENDCSDSRLKSIATILEMHYTTTLEDGDVIPFTYPNLAPPGAFDGNLGSLGNPAGRQDFLNLTVGVDTRLYETNIRPAVVFPLRGGDDQQFDFEFTLQVNRTF